MWIDFKPIYNTLETQTVFVRELCPKTPQTWAAYSNPQTSQLNLAHFTWVGLARLASTDPQIIFLYYPLDHHASGKCAKYPVFPHCEMNPLLCVS